MERASSMSSGPCVQVEHGESVEYVEWAVRTGRAWRERRGPCVQVGHGESVEYVEWAVRTGKAWIERRVCRVGHAYR